MRLFEREWSWESKPLGHPWHSLLLLAFAIALFAGCAYHYKSTRDFLDVAHRSTGVVIEVFEVRDGFYPRVRFPDSAGRQHEFDSDLISRPARFLVGEEVPLWYLPDAPGKARIAGFWDLWFTAVITGAIGLALTVAAVAVWILLRPEPAQRRHARRSMR
jgi:hypothetical protein